MHETFLNETDPPQNGNFLKYNRGQNSLRKLPILSVYFNLTKGIHRLKSSKPSLPHPLTQCCFEGRKMTQPWFQRQTNIDEGERGAVLLMYRCSGRMWRWTTIFLSELSTIVAFSGSGVFRC